MRFTLLWYLIKYEDGTYLNKELDKTLNIRNAFYFSTAKEALSVSKTLKENNKIVKLYISE